MARPALCRVWRQATAPHGPVDNDGLTRCLSATYDVANPNAAVAHCEEAHFGTEWRKEPSRAAEETSPAMAGTGNLDPRLIQAGMNARMHRIRACYRAGVSRNPALRGEIDVRFVIDTTGRAIRVEDAGSKLPDKQVVSCVLREVASLHFPRPEGSFVPVTYPFLFGPGDTYR